MSDYTRSLLRSLGILGAILVVLSPFFSWYSYEVVVQSGRVTNIFDVAMTLWGLTTLAPILLSAGAVAALVVMTLVTSRAAALATALIGLGVVAYALVRCFDIPDLGVSALANRPRVDAATSVDAGIFLAISGGALLVIAALGELLPSRAAESTPETAALGGRPRLGRRRRGAPASGRAQTPG
jgi:hypothetical protein